MSTDKVDAREAWLLKAEHLKRQAISCAITGMIGISTAEQIELADRLLSAHLITQPEGYVLVPVDSTMVKAGYLYRVKKIEIEKGRFLPAGRWMYSPEHPGRLGAYDVVDAMIAAAQEGK